jgi:hypothetical protein
MPKLTDKQKFDIESSIAGTPGLGSTYERMMEKYDITEEDIEEVMADAGWERCPECDWFVECSELVDAEGEDTACDSCDPDKWNED